MTAKTQQKIIRTHQVSWLGRQVLVTAKNESEARREGVKAICTEGCGEKQLSVYELETPWIFA